MMMNSVPVYSKAMDDVLSERYRQLDVEKFGVTHDDQYTDFQLAKAAASYLAFATCKDKTRKANLKNTFAPGTWPWASAWWKPKDRRRDLVRAAALIIAEIERLDRAVKS